MTSCIWASAGDNRKIFGRQIQTVRYQFDLKVVWWLYRKKILVHWSTELHIYSFPEDLVKSEKGFKTVPTFLFRNPRTPRRDLRALSLQFKLIYKFHIFAILWTMIFDVSINFFYELPPYDVTFQFFLYLPVRSFVRYPCLFLTISSHTVRQVFRVMLVLLSHVSLSVSLLLQQCLIVLYVFLRSFYVSL